MTGGRKITSSWSYVSTDSSNSLASRRQQAITCTNVKPGLWRHMASLGLKVGLMTNTCMYHHKWRNIKPVTLFTLILLIWSHSVKHGYIPPITTLSTTPLKWYALSFRRNRRWHNSLVITTHLRKYKMLLTFYYLTDIIQSPRGWYSENLMACFQGRVASPAGGHDQSDNTLHMERLHSLANILQRYE